MQSCFLRQSSQRQSLTEPLVDRCDHSPNPLALFCRTFDTTLTLAQFEKRCGPRFEQFSVVLLRTATRDHRNRPPARRPYQQRLPQRSGEGIDRIAPRITERDHHAARAIRSHDVRVLFSGRMKSHLHRHAAYHRRPDVFAVVPAQHDRQIRNGRAVSGESGAWWVRSHRYRHVAFDTPAVKIVQCALIRYKRRSGNREIFPLC